MHNWHCTIGFFINTALRNVYFILHYHLCFRKDFFSSVCISVNMIFECSYLSFGWKRGHPLSMYVTGGMEGAHPKCLQKRAGEEEYHASCVRTHLHYLFSCFYLMVSCFIFGNLTLPSFKKVCLSEMVIFLQWDQFLF